MIITSPIKKFFSFYWMLAALITAVSVNGIPYQSTIKVTNNTGAQLTLITLDKPFTPGDMTTKRRSTLVLSPGQTDFIAPAGRIVGWSRPGVPLGFTVLMPSDTQLTFVLNSGLVKSLHGEVRNQAIENTKEYTLTVATKNPNIGHEGCASCANKCYTRDFTLDFCNCLNTCYDNSRDLNWYIHPYTRQVLRVAAETKLSLQKPAHTHVYTVYEDEAPVVTHRRVTIYNP